MIGGSEYLAGLDGDAVVAFVGVEILDDVEELEGDNAALLVPDLDELLDKGAHVALVYLVEAVVQKVSGAVWSLVSRHYSLLWEGAISSRSRRR